MKFKIDEAILTFFIGFIISFAIGNFFADSNLAIAAAVCYVAAIIVGIFGKSSKN